MKKQTIWIIVGVIALILIIANWNKIFGKRDKMAFGGFSNPSPPKTTPQYKR